ncbi:probable polygalacturonase At3g15720 [Abrus precatorius]|uniref:Probable polygalacturonase At3g15720 n=1 Tax=Abrus precatorius TaxID=3816 RepID=A0A8B8K045_ABRPR|nr:probable polygalacturonase At3g15720 [Abrus precatorius]
MEIDLANLNTIIQSFSQSQKTISLPDKTEKAISLQKGKTSNTNHYMAKGKFSSVIQMEPEFWDKNPYKAITKAFPPGFHFRPYALNKTRQFYEFILIDSDSALRFHGCNGLTVKYLRNINGPGSHISVNGCEGAKFSQINIHAPQESPNTDGFDISASKNILIQDSTIGTGDDCIAINGGSSYISIVGVACGPGHGISIGSLGRNQGHETVEEVHVRNCSFTRTTNGARIKTWPGGSGYARRIIFKQIKLIDTRNPIIIDQYYGHNISMDAAVKVSDVIYRGFSGTSSDAKAIDLQCSKSGCFNIILNQINIVSAEQGKHAYASCKNVHGIVISAIPNVSCLLN